MSDDKNKGYFDLSKALDEVRHESFGAKDTAVAGLKLFGKGVFNAARFAVTEVIPAAVEQTAKHNARTSKELLKRDDLTDEQRDRLEKVRGKSDEYLEVQEEKRREQEALEAEVAREGAWAEDAQSMGIGDRATPVHREVFSQMPPEPPAMAERKSMKPSDSQYLDHPPSEQLGGMTGPDQSAGVKRAPPAFAASVARREVDIVLACAVATSSARLVGQPPELAEYLQLITGAHERIYVGQQIPENKLENAWKGRPAYCRKRRALLLADDTVMGGGKDGLLVTDEHISFKAAFSDSHDYSSKFARKLTVPDGFKFHLIPSEVINMLLGQLRAFFADRLQWHERAAENGDRDSQFFLSMQYENADERGPYWLIRAAQAGHATAQHNLGMELKQSDRGLAMHWFELAAAQGHELAFTRLTDLRRAPAGSTGEAQIPKGTTRLIDLMSPQAMRELEQNIDASRQAMRRAMQRIADEERRLCVATPL
jgi:hypothetical protein